jgi:SH3-like domain-containing protein
LGTHALLLTPELSFEIPGYIFSLVYLKKNYPIQIYDSKDNWGQTCDRQQTNNGKWEGENKWHKIYTSLLAT